MNDHNFACLRAFILSHSISQVWASARLEWQLDAVEDLGHIERDRCPCGYEPIRYLCWLFNVKTKTRVYVYVCANRFMRTRRVDRDRWPETHTGRSREGTKRSVTQLGAEDASDHTMGYDFGMDTFRRRSLSIRQWEKRREIDRRHHHG